MWVRALACMCIHEHGPINPGDIATHLKLFSHCHVHNIQHGEQYAVCSLVEVGGRRRRARMDEIVLTCIYIAEAIAMHQSPKTLQSASSLKWLPLNMHVAK